MWLVAARAVVKAGGCYSTVLVDLSSGQVMPLRHYTMCFTSFKEWCDYCADVFHCFWLFFMKQVDESHHSWEGRWVFRVCDLSVDKTNRIISLLSLNWLYKNSWITLTVHEPNIKLFHNKDLVVHWEFRWYYRNNECTDVRIQLTITICAIAEQQTKEPFDLSNVCWRLDI